MPESRKLQLLTQDYKNLMDKIYAIGKLSKNLLDNREFDRILKNLENTAKELMLPVSQGTYQDISGLSRRFTTLIHLLREIYNQEFSATGGMSHGKSRRESSGQIILLLRETEKQFDNFFTSLVGLYVVDIAIPNQIPAPVKVALVNNEIVLNHSKRHIGTVSDNSLDKIREGIKDILERTIALLAATGNADPRLAPTCEGLLGELSRNIDDISVEALGLNWQIVTETLKITEETLPDVIISQLRRVLTTVNVILSQYEEWQVYLAAEASIKINAGELRRAIKEAGRVVEFTEEHQNVVHPSVTDRLRDIIDPALVGIVQTDTLAAPLIGSISNIFAVLSHVAMEAIPSLATPTGMTSASLVVLNVAVVAIRKFAPTLSHFPPLSWLSDVHNEIIKNWSLIKDVAKF